jgi:hypothetical protein
VEKLRRKLREKVEIWRRNPLKTKGLGVGGVYIYKNIYIIYIYYKSFVFMYLQPSPPNPLFSTPYTP